MTRTHDLAVKEAGPLAVGLLFIVSLLGYFKGTFLITWMGFDPTVALVILLALVATRYARQANLRSGLWWPVLVLFAGFIPGAVASLRFADGRYKSAYLFSVTLLVCLAAILMIGSLRSKRLWVNATLVGASAMALVVLLDPNADYASLSGRLTAEGTSSILSARLLLAGAVVLFIRGITAAGLSRFVNLGIALAFTGIGIQAGTKGPVLGAGIALVVAVLCARGFQSARFGTVLASSGIIAAGIFVLFSSHSSGALRIVNFASGESSDLARPFLWRAARSSVWHEPLGIGWGMFPDSPYLPPYLEAPYPHNLFLEVFAEGGVVAGAGLCVFIAVALRGCWLQSSSRVGAELFALSVYWVVVAQVSSDINGNRVTLVALAIGLACSLDRKGPSVGQVGPSPEIMGADRGVRGREHRSPGAGWPRGKDIESPD